MSNKTFPKKKFFKKIFPKNPRKKWDPLLDALIPEMFEFPQSEQWFLSYERTYIFGVTDTTTIYIQMTFFNYAFWKVSFVPRIGDLIALNSKP